MFGHDRAGARSMVVMIWLGVGCSSTPERPVAAVDPIFDASSHDARADRDQATDGISDAKRVGDSPMPSDAFDSAPDAAPDVDECATGIAVSIAPPADTGGALCTTTGWGTGTPVDGVSAAGDDTFGAITPDGLTIAWTAVEGAKSTIHFADRDTTDAPFGHVHLIAAGYYAPGRVALSSDGLRLIAVLAGGKAFGEYTRVLRTDAFSTTASDAAFDALNSLGLSFAQEEFFGDPILSSDDLTLYYSRYGGSQVQTIYASVRPELVGWPVGTPLEGRMLIFSCGKRRRPTGISSDALTLFYWDDLSGTERAAYRLASGSAFTGAIDLGMFAEAQPNAACDALYFSAGGTMGLDILRASRK